MLSFGRLLGCGWVFPLNVTSHTAVSVLPLWRTMSFIFTRVSCCVVRPRLRDMITSCTSLRRYAGGIVRIEPRNFNEDRVRPDLEVILPDRVVLLDVAVTDPAAPSRKSCAPLAAARVMESSKRAKYARLAASRGASFLAFAVETFGAFGAQAVQVLNVINSYSSRFSFGPSGPRGRALPAQFLAVAIQKGNPLVDRYGALAARAAVQRG